eukprot:8625609-Karenia_brevis.AAC.1
MRKSISQSIPPCIPAFGSRTLNDVLGSFGHTPRSTLTETQRGNLKDYENTIKEQFHAGELKKDDIA